LPPKFKQNWYGGNWVFLDFINLFLWINLPGALTALEQGDLEAFSAILARNNQPEQQQQFRVDEPLDGGVYALFEPRLRLLDVALMLGRKRAAEMLMENGAQDDWESEEWELLGELE
jgi:hypothetical protein